MGEVIDFPGHGEVGVRKALDYFKSTYAKAGLTENQINTAMTELEPIVRSFLIRKEFEFNLSGHFTEDQVALILEAHNLTMNSAIRHFSQSLWLALCNIAWLIGRGAQNG